MCKDFEALHIEHNARRLARKVGNVQKGASQGTRLNERSVGYVWVGGDQAVGETKRNASVVWIERLRAENDLVAKALARPMLAFDRLIWLYPATSSASHTVLGAGTLGHRTRQ